MLPEPFQNFAFMVIQYLYAVFTMIPCFLWYSSRIYSLLFLSAVGLWSVWNGATYYIDHYKANFQKQLNELRAEMSNWQQSQSSPNSPFMATSVSGQEEMESLRLTPSATSSEVEAIKRN